MERLTFQDLEDRFELALKSKHKYMAVAIRRPFLPRPELVVNRTKDFYAKLEYYGHFYNDNLEHMCDEGVEICNFHSADSLCELAHLFEEQE